jgi:hypothetical protein
MPKTGESKRPLAINDEIRAKFPKLVEKAENGSRAAAVKLECLVCFNGSARSAKACTSSKTCWLWPHAFGRGKTAAGAVDDADDADDATETPEENGSDETEEADR